MTAHEQDNVSPVSAPPGQKLAAERKKQGLTEREVADQLKITLSKLHALEQDQYDKFPAQIYLKGYLKNYARLLRISEQEINDAYHAHSKQDVNDEEYTPAIETKVETQPNKTWLVLLAIAAVALLLFFIFPKSQPVANDDAAAIFESPTSYSNDQSDEVAATIDTQAVENILPGTNSAVQDPASGSLASPAAGESEVAPVIELPEQAVEILASKVTAAELISLSEPQLDVEDPVVEVVNLTDVLDFEFANQCWIEVRDSTGSLLYSGLENAGSQRQIEGEGPFQVVIGNVAGTVLSFNGEAIVLQEPANGRALRFQVGS